MPVALALLRPIQRGFGEKAPGALRGVLSLFFMAVCGVSRVFHLEGLHDAGFALLTGGRRVLTRHWLGGWVRHVRTRAARLFSRMTQRLRSYEGKIAGLSLDEHVVARWTRKLLISKGYHTTRNKHLRCEKLFYFFDLAGNAFRFMVPTLGRIGLCKLARPLIRMFRREARPAAIRLIVDAGATLKHSEFRALLLEPKLTVLARAPRSPRLMRQWKALPPERFVEHREPGEWVKAPEKRLFVAETRTTLKGDRPEDRPVRTIVAKESAGVRGRPTKDRWHIIFTNDEITSAYDLIREFRTRQHHEQGYRVLVHDEALDATTNGYNKKARDRRRPGFNHGPIHIVAWVKALAYNAMRALSERLPGRLARAHPRTLRRFFLNRPGTIWQTPTDLIVQMDYFPEQRRIEHLIADLNEATVRLPWHGDRRLVLSLTPEPKRHENAEGCSAMPLVGRTVWC